MPRSFVGGHEFCGTGGVVHGFTCNVEAEFGQCVLTGPELVDAKLLW